MGSSRISAQELFVRGREALLAGDVDAAIPALERCLDTCQPGDPTRADAAQHLAAALTDVYRRGGGTRDDAMRLVARLGTLELAVPASVRDAVSLTMADILLDIYDRWHMVADLSAANDLYDVVARESAKDWSERATLMKGLAKSNHLLDNLIPNPYTRLERAGESVAALREVIAIQENDDDHPSLQERYDLAAALRLRGFLRRTLDEDRADTDTGEALELLVRLRELDPPAGFMPAIANIEGLCWKDRRGTHPDAMDKEVEAFENAVEHLRDISAAGDPIIERNLANALANRHAQGGKEHDLSRAFTLYAGSAEASSQDPVATALTGLNWVGAALGARRWDDAIDAGESTLTTWVDIAAGQLQLADSLDVVSSLGLLGRQLALAYLETGEPLAAAASIDRTRNTAAAALRTRIAVDRGDVAPARDLDGVIAAMEASSGDRTLCYLLAAEGRMDAILVYGSSSVVATGPLAMSDLGERLSAYVLALGAFSESGRRRQLNRLAVDTFDAELDRLGRWVGDTVLRPLLQQVPAGAPIALIPTGWLGLIPFQISQVPDDLGREAWLVDRHRLALSYSSTGNQGLDPSDWLETEMLLVADPDQDDLTAVAVEGDAIRAAWHGSVSPPVTTVQNVLDWSGDGPLHFACHASFDQRRPLDSALRLRDGAVSIRDLAHQDLHAPLAFLGACSTGEPALSLPDETVSLGHAFAIAGVREIVSTNWPVYDVAAAAIATSFYEYLCEAGLSIAESFQRAQQDVRDGVPPTGRLTAAFHDRLSLPHPLPLAFWAGFSHATR